MQAHLGYRQTQAALPSVLFTLSPFLPANRQYPITWMLGDRDLERQKASWP